MMNFKFGFLLSSCALVTIALFIVGCETTPPKPPETRTIDYGIPEFSYEADAKPVQKKEGITISLVPVTYGAERKIKIEDGQMRPPPFTIFKDPNKEIIGVFDRAEIPYYVIVPIDLIGSGIVSQFGKASDISVCAVRNGL